VSEEATKPALSVVPAVIATAEETPAAKPLENPLIDAFVKRYEDARKPGILLEFVAKFLDHMMADKIQEDAKATFSGKSMAELIEMRIFVKEKEWQLAEKNLAERKAADEKAKADEQAKRDAAKSSKPKLGKRRK
jgi:hypothetical protein